MIVPAHVKPGWLATLDNEQLLVAEAQLFSAFREFETVDKARQGSRYKLLEGSSELLYAWQQWTLVNNEARLRRVRVRRATA
jgi:hypothetical protein